MYALCFLQRATAEGIEAKLAWIPADHARVQNVVQARFAGRENECGWIVIDVLDHKPASELRKGHNGIIGLPKKPGDG